MAPQKRTLASAAGLGCERNLACFIAKKEEPPGFPVTLEVSIDKAGPLKRRAGKCNRRSSPEPD